MLILMLPHRLICQLLSDLTQLFWSATNFEKHGEYMVNINFDFACWSAISCTVMNIHHSVSHHCFTQDRTTSKMLITIIYPLVIQHGWLGNPTFVDYFWGGISSHVPECI